MNSSRIVSEETLNKNIVNVDGAVERLALPVPLENVAVVREESGPEFIRQEPHQMLLPEPRGVWESVKCLLQVPDLAAVATHAVFSPAHLRR